MRYEQSIRSKVPRIEFPGQFTTTALAEESATLALETALQFYREFGCTDPDPATLSNQQERFQRRSDCTSNRFF